MLYIFRKLQNKFKFRTNKKRLNNFLFYVDCLIPDPQPDDNSFVCNRICKTKGSSQEKSAEELFRDFQCHISNRKLKTLGNQIKFLVDTRGIQKDSSIYTKANISKEYWSELINDKYKNPSKIKLIRIGLALELTSIEMIELLKIAGYCFKPIKQDYAFLWFFQQHIYDFIQIDELLTHFGLNSIYNDKELL